ncbi:MAG TPA: PQQ-binding-like beta-propeller repeat protein [Phycisphaerales bacterium]|nr:PQQ-binding-like beta-propeller repeat protein [Phycisphaerales bacterium]HMP37321.1 PQQ-binding-like beta-propeller repeat protein [Phycisphaerales bacterium]
MPTRALAFVVALLAIIHGIAVGRGAAQSSSPVAVDDSPWASEQLRRAADQASSNPAEALRLIQAVLDEQPSKVVPWPLHGGGGDRFRAAREVANALLRERPPLWQRYRSLAEPAAQRRLESGDVEGTWRSALLTRAGLRAALLIAQRDLEEGRFSAARLRIAEAIGHPELAGDLALHAEIIDGLAAAAQQDLDGAVAAMAALRGDASDPRVSEAGAAAIERLLAGAPLPALRRGTGTLDRASVAPPETADAWLLLDEQPLPATPYARAMTALQEMPGFNRDFDRLRTDASMLTAAPTEADGVVWISEGGAVRAFDALSGRLHWMRTLPSAVRQIDATRLGDVNAIAVEGDALVTVAGHAGPVGRLGGNRIFCLDARTGEVRWALHPSMLLGGFDGGDDFATTFAHGSPVIREGLVYLLLRKVTSRIETVTYLAAIDLATGRPRWVRHVCTSAGLRLGSTRAYASPTWEGGRVYVALSTGAAACLDGATGEVIWLHRLPVPVREPRFDAEPWEIGGPLLLDDALLVTAPDQLAVLRLDRRDGRLLAEQPIGRTEALGIPRYFLAAPEDPLRGLPDRALAVGSDVICFDPAAPTTVLWRLSQMPAVRDLPPDERSGVRGRVQVAGRTAIVPLRDRVLRIDIDSGAARVLVEGTEPGNPLAVGPQLLLATNDTVRSYMPFAEALLHLRLRIAEDPASVDHGMGMIQLGLRSGSLSTTVEGSRAALAAIGRMEDPVIAAARKIDVFDRLLAASEALVKDGARGPDAALGRELHTVLERLAMESPARLAMALLARAAWLDQIGAAEESVGDLARVLSEPALGRALLAGGAASGREIERSASIIARQRLGALRSERPALAAELDAAAEAALVGLWNEVDGGSLGETAAVDAARALAEAAIPLTGSPAALAATRRACAALIAAGRVSEASSTALRSWRALRQMLTEEGSTPSGGAVERSDDAMPPEPAAPGTIAALLSEAAGLVVETLLAADAPARALAFVDGGVVGAAVEAIVVDGAPMSIESLRTLLVARGAENLPRSPSLGRFRGEAQELSGRLIRGWETSSGGGVRMPADRILVAVAPGAEESGPAIRLLDAALEGLWTRQLDDPDPAVLRFDDRELLLWSGAGAAARVISLDPVDGALRWTTPGAAPPGSDSGAPPQTGSEGEAGDAPSPAGAAGGAAFGDRAGRASRRRAEERPAESAARTEVRPLLAGNRLVLAAEDGSLRAFDLRRQGAPSWERRGGARQGERSAPEAPVVAGLSGAWSDDGLLLVGGLDDGGRPVVAALDPANGAERARHRLGAGARVLWLRGSVDGLAIVGTTVGVEAFDPQDGELVWRSTAASLGGAAAPWRAGEWMLLADAAQQLAAIRPFDATVGGTVGGAVGESGRGGERFSLRQVGLERSAVRAVTLDEEGVVVLFEQRVAEFDGAGNLRGVDASVDTRDNRFVLLSGPRMIVVSAVGVDQVETGGGRRARYTLRASTFDRLQGCKLVDAALQISSIGQRFDRAAVIDGWLLLSTPGAISAVPLPAPRLDGQTPR